MDRSTDGGMAPALQSSNHQSTELTNEGEVNEAGSALLHKKVNGKSCKVNSPLDEKTPKTGVADIALHPTDTEERTPDKINKDTGLDSCFSSGPKRIASEGVMPKLQVGQGDSVVGHIANCNGWGNSKKSIIDGILQESNNLSAVWPGIKTSNTKMSPLKCGDSGANPKISCNGDSENRNSDQASHKSNGHSMDQQTPAKESPGTLLQDSCGETEESYKLPSSKTCVVDSAGHEPAESEILSAADKCSAKTQSVVPAEYQTCTLSREMTEIDSASESSNSKCGLNSPIHEEHVENSCTKSPFIESSTSDSIPKPLNCQNSHDAGNDEQSLTHTLESADNMFLYSQILPGDLKAINMSDNLTNTLQELAASLKEASFPLQLDVKKEIVSREANNTVNTDNDVVNTLHSSAKSLDFSEDDCTERETRILDRTNHAAHCVGILEHRLGLLKQNLLKYRSKILRKHVHDQFVAIASHLPRQDWENHPIDVEDTSFAPTADLWQKILENKPAAPSKSILCRTNTQDVEVRGKKFQPDTDLKTSPDALETTEDSAMQLVNLHSSKSPLTTDLCEIAHEKAGLLKKELQFAKSCCDPEITDSSSDEDFREAYEDVSRKTKVNLKSNTKPRVTRYRKSFCRWVAERAEISRKWTWLQSRIAGMEFQIRNQGDLYNQLRSNKGMVRLVPQSTENHDRVENVAADNMDEADDCVYATEAQTSSSSPPCSINHVLDNVNHQASRLMDTLSPVSGGWPSPVQEMKTSESSSSVSNVQSAAPSCHNASSLEAEDQCARTIALDRFVFKTRKLVRINQKGLDISNALQPATVPNDSSIMCPEQKRRSTGSEDYSSLILKAAVHDHSYHATISSLKDIPLSSSIQAVMKSKHKWSKKSDPSKKDKPKKAIKKVKKSEKKLQRSLNANHLEEVVEKKRRRLASQLSEVSSRKRTAGSMDSDLDSQVIIGGFNSHQFAPASGTTTPTSEMFASSQNNWKKKKLTEQTFDINNIVIPHGLTTSRIEKLVYKEIQTPSWKILNVTNPDMPQENGNNLYADKAEDTSDAIFQNRHENYEISEKKKFMSLVQSRRSRRGFRNSTMRESTAQDPASPMPVSGEGEAHSGVVDALSTMSSSQLSSTMSPTAKPGAARRLSGDHFAREQRPPSPHTLPQSQRNLDTSYAACPSPTTPLCPSGPGSRRNSHDNPAHIQRTLSCNINKVEETNCDGWEIRDFPLSEEDVKFLDDIDLAKTMLRASSHNGTMYRSLDGEDTGRHSTCRTQNTEKNLHDYSKLALNDVSRDAIKSTVRRRTDSRGSSLASFDDSARHSDASSTSVSSSRRKKKGWHGTPEVLSHRNGNMSGKGSKKLTAGKSKHKYIHVRLSETDDSSTDSDGDTTDSSYTSDDAGHLIDDFADPEWEAPRPRERR